MRGGLDVTPLELRCYGMILLSSCSTPIVLSYTNITSLCIFSTTQFISFTFAKASFSYTLICLFVHADGIEEKDENDKEEVVMTVVPKMTAKERRREERRIKFGDRKMEGNVGEG